jgi:uncharacterized RDD family membrane protein YckC
VARRLLSGLIDAAVISFLTLPFAATRHVVDAFSRGGNVSGHDLRAASVVNLLVTVGYMTALHSLSGSTLGKMAARTVVRNEDGTKISPQVAFVRAVSLAGIQFISAFLLAPMVVNELRPLWTPRRQTWHDAIAKTVVLTLESAPSQNLTE